MTASDRTVLVFGETRILRDPRGYRTFDRGVAGRSWTRSLDGVPGLGLAMRVEYSDRELTGSYPVDVHDVAELPHYVGVQGMLKTLPRLLATIDSAVERSDVVMARLPGLMGLLAIAAAWRHRTPVALEVVGDVRDVLEAGTLGRLGTLAARPLQWLTAVAARRASAARYMTRTTLQQRYPVRSGVPSVGFSSVQLPDDWVRPPADVSASSSDAPTILAVGSHEQMYKGHDVLIRALPGVLVEHPGARLQLVGKGRMQGDLKELAHELDVQGNVDFLGFLSDRSAMRDLLDSATLFCMPSRTEGLPRVLVEAMARGLPGLGSPAGGIPELLPPEYLIPTTDIEAWSREMSRLLHDPAERAAMGRRNALEAATYSVSALEPQVVRWQTIVTDLTERAR